VTLPKDRLVVAPGRLIEDSVDGDRRRYVFRTTRPQKASSVYIGKFQHKSGEADGTKIEVYVNKDEKNLSFGVIEIQNVVKVFNRLFVPLDLETFRVVAAPIDHGRGFDGLLLLSRGVGFESSSSDAFLFRAHEVAHQWWGNIVAPDRYPRDRWLSEAFAEYSGMEYHRERFQDAKKTSDTIFRQWMMPLQRAGKSGSKNLRGDVRTASMQELWSVLDGGQNVYTKGPMVLQMLRYLIRVKTGSDDAFWEILRSFAKESAGKPASTEDFIKVSERVVGGDLHWFFNQWLWRTEIPKVRWSQRLEPKDGKLLLTVDAEQIGTEFVLLIPVYVHMGGDNVVTRPLLMKGRTGRVQMLVAQEPNKVTINDNWEALLDVVP
jgi:aminopeptidase N